MTDAKVLEEEIKTAFFYPSNLVNTKTTQLWSVKSGGYIHRHFASPPLSSATVPRSVEKEWIHAPAGIQASTTGTTTAKTHATKKRYMVQPAV